MCILYIDTDTWVINYNSWHEWKNIMNFRTRRQFWIKNILYQRNCRQEELTWTPTTVIIQHWKAKISEPVRKVLSNATINRLRSTCNQKPFTSNYYGETWTVYFMKACPLWQDLSDRRVTSVVYILWLVWQVVKNSKRKSILKSISRRHPKTK